MKYFTEDVILKFQRGGSNKKKKDDGKKKPSGNSQQTTTTNEYRTVLGGMPSWYRPPQPIIDDMGGGLAPAYHYNQRQAQILETQRQQAEAAEAEYQAYRRTNPTVNREEYFSRIKPMLEYQANHPQPTIGPDPLTPELRLRRRNQRQFLQTADYLADLLGQSMGSVGQLNATTMMANLSGGAQAGAWMVAPEAMLAYTLGRDLSEGNYGGAAFDLGLYMIPGAKQVRQGVQEVKQATNTAVQNTKQAVKRTAQNVGNRVNGAVEGFNAYRPEPVYQPYVFADGTMGLMPGNYNQMNMFGRIKGAINGFKQAGKSTAASTEGTTTSAAEAANTVDNELADIRYVWNRNKKVKVTGPSTETHSVNGEPINKSEIKLEPHATHIDEQGVPHLVHEEKIPGSPEVAHYEDPLGNTYPGNKPPITFDRPTPQTTRIVDLPEVPTEYGIFTDDGGTRVWDWGERNWFLHGTKMYPESAIETKTIPGPRVKPGEGVPEGALVWIKNKPRDLNDKQMFRTATGKGYKSWVNYEGTPIRFYKNPGFYHQLGSYGTAAFLGVGAPNIYKAVKGIIKGTTSGNGAVPGVINEFSGNNTTDTVPTTNINNDSIQAVKEGQEAAERRIDSVISSQVEAKRNLYNRNVNRGQQ